MNARRGGGGGGGRGGRGGGRLNAKGWTDVAPMMRAFKGRNMELPQSIALPDLEVLKGTLPSVWRLFLTVWKLGPLRPCLYFAGSLIEGILPAVNVYTDTRFIEAVQQILNDAQGRRKAPAGERGSRLGHVIRLAVIRVLSSISVKLVRYILSTSNATMDQDLSAKMELDFYNAVARLDLPTLESDKNIQTLREAQEIITFRPFTVITYVTDLWKNIVQLIAQGFAIRQALATHARTGAEGTNQQRLIRYLLFILCFCQPLLRMQRFWSRIFATKTEDKESDRRRMGQMTDTLLSSSFKKEVILHNSSPWLISEWHRLQERQAKQQKQSFDGSLQNLIQQGVYNTLDAATFVVLAWDSLQGSSTVTSLASLQVIRGATQQLLQSITGPMRMSRAMVRTFQRIDGYYAALRLQPTLTFPGSEGSNEKAHRYTTMTELIEGKQCSGMKIELRNVTFTYPGSSVPSLKNISMTIHPGETIALVGYNGSGKSTLIKLIMRLYDPDEGSVLINDVDAKLYDPRDIYDRIGVTFQDYSRYQLSARDNIGLAATSFIDDLDALKNAAGLAGVHETIASLPEGYETSIRGTRQSETAQTTSILDGEKSWNADEGQRALSGGEWQKLAIARAFLRDMRYAHDQESLDGCDLFVLDEPSAALDAKAEYDLFERLEGLQAKSSLSSHERPQWGNEAGQRRTTVYVSHRFTSVRKATTIYVMGHGEIIESGTHEKLLDTREGRYQELFRLASKAFE